MKAKIGIGVGVLVLLFFFFTSDGRPNVTEAKTEIERTYPGVQIVSVKVTLDEVEAREFKIEYRKPGDSKNKEAGVQFMEGPNKKWIVSPVLELK